MTDETTREAPTKWGSEHKLGAAGAAGAIKPEELNEMAGKTRRFDTYNNPDQRVRSIALEQAIKISGADVYKPERIVKAAELFEQYLRDGATTMRAAAAQPTGPRLPSDFVSLATEIPSDTLYAVHLVMAERFRQIGKGWTPEHDDTHDDQRIAFEAACAIAPDGTRHLAPLDQASFWQTPWVKPGQLRTAQLVQGIALALAELERVHRENDRIDTKQRDAQLSEETRAAERAAGNIPSIRPEDIEGAAPPPVAELDSLDFERMHHALGRPRDPLIETYRNRFGTPGNSHLASRFRELPEYWEEPGAQPGDDGGPKMRYFAVTDAGRAALARAILERPEKYRFEIENGASAIPPADGDA